MALHFPNSSRSFDATRRSVRFWGHDGALEISFFIEEDALHRIAPATMRSEAAALKVFDGNRDRILKAAKGAYARRRQGSYCLVASDF